MSDRSNLASGSGLGRLAYAAVLYFSMVFAVGLLLGPPRVLWLEPRLGATLAVALETPVLIVAMWFAARAAPRWAGVVGGAMSLLGVGLMALVLQQACDLAVGLGLRGITLSDQLAYFMSPAGMIYGAALIAFAIMPLLRSVLAGRPATEARAP